MAKRTYTYDGSEWVGLTSPAVSLDNYPNMTTTPISGFRNAIINGGFDIWQRGTSITPTDGGYNADRWLTWLNGSGSTRLITQQSFTPGAGVIAGQEPKYFLRYNQSVAGTGATYNYLLQKIEDVRTFAGQTISISFWAKTSANTTIPGILIGQAYGSGGSPSSFQYTTVATSIAVTTSWTKFTYTVSVPSLSGKTLGTNPDSSLHMFFSLPVNATFTFDVWGVQVESGTRATPFEQRPIGTELALCQRYFYSRRADNTDKNWGWGWWEGNNAFITFVHPCEMRIAPAFSFNGTSGIQVVYPAVAWYNVSGTISNHHNGTKTSNMLVGVSGASVPQSTQALMATTGTGGALWVSAEL
jgi:hypothetical protein